MLAALEAAQLVMADLDAVVVGCGPGPFTGLRVGMATAAALGQALGYRYSGSAASTRSVGGQPVTFLWSPTRGAARSVGALPRRRPIRRAWSVRPRMSPVGEAAAVAGSPDHAALFPLPVVAPAQPSPEGTCCGRG